MQLPQSGDRTRRHDRLVTEDISKIIEQGEVPDVRITLYIVGPDFRVHPLADRRPEPDAFRRGGRRVVDGRTPPAAEPTHERIEHDLGRRGGHGCIECVPSTFEHACPDFGGDGLGCDDSSFHTQSPGRKVMPNSSL